MVLDGIEVALEPIDIIEMVVVHSSTAPFAKQSKKFQLEVKVRTVWQVKDCNLVMFVFRLKVDKVAKSQV